MRRNATRCWNTNFYLCVANVVALCLGKKIWLMTTLFVIIMMQGTSVIMNYFEPTLDKCTCFYDTLYYVLCFRMQIVVNHCIIQRTLYLIQTHMLIRIDSVSLEEGYCVCSLCSYHVSISDTVHSVFFVFWGVFSQDADTESDFNSVRFINCSINVCNTSIILPFTN